MCTQPDLRPNLVVLAPGALLRGRLLLDRFGQSLLVHLPLGLRHIHTLLGHHREI